jgi:hypothetical protein
MGNGLTCFGNHMTNNECSEEAYEGINELWHVVRKAKRKGARVYGGTKGSEVTVV